MSRIMDIQMNKHHSFTYNTVCSRELNLKHTCTFEIVLPPNEFAALINSKAE